MTPCVSVGQKWERSLHVNSRRTSVLFPCGWLVFSDHWWGGDISGGTGKSGKEQQLIGVWWGDDPLGCQGRQGGNTRWVPRARGSADQRLHTPHEWYRGLQFYKKNVTATAFLATLREHQQTMFAINPLFHLCIGLLRLQRSIRFNQSNQRNKWNQSQHKNEK